MNVKRRFLIGLAALLLPALAAAQTKPAQRRNDAPALSAARTIVAGAPLSVFLTRMPQGARLAIARPDDPADKAIVVVEPRTTVPTLPTPGAVGIYELRLTVEKAGAPTILLRQPLATTEPSATLAAPERVGRGQGVPVRGIGPNGEQDRVMLVKPDAPADTDGPRFFPAENVEATLEAPDQPGVYELRYILHAPLAEHRILARRLVRVE
ncbi:Ca-activated chloride channel family protein [Bosea robiniae]|uniref:Ca-activated chloride channel family protein n=1 Tax=Bosea robiniae TaxID=1036780 RepID=A0ABY0NSN3_9HYPH|nr:Ca-activated chloride channel family protein [Bosea robiniae]